MKKIISMLLLAVTVLSLASCGKSKPKVTVEKPKDSSSSDTSSTEELAKIDLTKTLSNSKHCDMKYEISMPDFEYDKDYSDFEMPEYSSYTRVYKTTDKKFKYYVTEYLGTERFVGNLDRDYGKSSHTEADGILSILANIVEADVGYADNLQILDNFATDIGNGVEVYGIALQLPNELDDYYFVKGYIAVGLKHPIAVYFFDGTPEGSYDTEMQEKSLAIIKSLKVSE